MATGHATAASADARAAKFDTMSGWTTSGEPAARTASAVSVRTTPRAARRRRAAGAGTRFASRSASRSTRRRVSSAGRSLSTSTASRRIRRRPDWTRCARRWPPGSVVATPFRASTRPRRFCRSTGHAKRCSPSPSPSSTPRVVRRSSSGPNPFYQIYEGAALLAGAEPVFLNQTAGNGFGLDLDSVSDEEWRRVATDLRLLAGQSHRAGADARRVARAVRTLGSLRLCHRVGRMLFGDLRRRGAPRRSAGSRPLSASAVHDFRERWSSSPACRSARTPPGLRSGAVAGDAGLLRQFLLYRTYHGCAMSLAVQHASIAAWSDEAHVRENRAKLSREVRNARADARAACCRRDIRTPASTCGRRVPGGRRRGVRATTCLRPPT